MIRPPPARRRGLDGECPRQKPRQPPAAIQHPARPAEVGSGRQHAKLSSFRDYRHNLKQHIVQRGSVDCCRGHHSIKRVRDWTPLEGVYV
jgi:hypothetical protein